MKIDKRYLTPTQATFLRWDRASRYSNDGLWAFGISIVLVSLGIIHVSHTWNIIYCAGLLASALVNFIAYPIAHHWAKKVNAERLANSVAQFQEEINKDKDEQ